MHNLPEGTILTHAKYKNRTLKILYRHSTYAGYWVAEGGAKWVFLDIWLPNWRVTMPQQPKSVV